MELHRKIYPGINYSDPAFRVEDTGRCRLNIFLNDSQFLFSVTDPQTQEVRHVQSYNFFQVTSPREFTESVKLILDSEDLFYQPFAECRVTFYNEQSTLVPQELFDPGKLDAYLSLNIETMDDAEPAYDLVEEADASNVYAVPVAIKRMLEQKFTSVKARHASTPLLKQWLKDSAGKSEPSLCVYVQPRVLQVLHAKKGKPVFFNAFAYTTPEDFVYFILYACQHLHLDPETVHVHLLGEIVKDSVLYEFTFKYIRHIHFGKRPDGVKISDGFNMPEHFYYNLFCIGL